jgi:toxin ParE1/3/4
MAHRLGPQARVELDDIWDYIARASGDAAVADRVIDTIVDRFYLLARYPRLGRARDNLRPGLRSFPAGEYVIVYTIEQADVLILHVIHSRRDIEGLIGR